MSRFIASLLLSGLASAAGPVHAQWLYHDSLYADPSNLANGASGIQFGRSMAIDRNADGSLRAVYVGLPYATVTDVQGTDHPAAGKVEVWVPQGGWHLARTLTNGGYTQAGAHFGAAIAVHRGAILIGSPDQDTQSGSNTRIDAGILMLMADDNASVPGQAQPDIRTILWWSGTAAGQKLGWSATIDGDGVSAGIDDAWFAFGTPYASGAGCATVGHLANGGQSNLMSNVCGPNASNFGSSLAIRHLDSSHFMLAVGAPAAAQGDQQLAGQVGIYIAPTSPPLDQPLLLETLTATSPAFLDAFGTSVAMDGSRIHVGGTGRQKSGVGRTGSVSIFKPCGIIGHCLETEVFGPTAGDLCGAALAANTRAIGAAFAMGCPGYDDTVDDAGRVAYVRYRYLAGSWSWAPAFIGMGDLPHGGDGLGRSVALASGFVFAGAPGNDDLGSNNGVVRIFAPDRIFADDFD